jgi:hypothetical protein
MPFSSIPEALEEIRAKSLGLADLQTHRRDGDKVPDIPRQQKTRAGFIGRQSDGRIIWWIASQASPRGSES